MTPIPQDNYRGFRDARGRFAHGNAGGNGRPAVKRPGVQALLNCIDSHIKAMVEAGDMDKVVKTIVDRANAKHGGSGLIEFLKELQSLGILLILMNQADRAPCEATGDGPEPTGITICMFKETPPSDPLDQADPIAR